MTTTTPRLYRRPDRGPFGGVAAGIAEHVGVRPGVIRASFVGLSFAGGLGIALYGAYLIVLPTPPRDPANRVPRWVEYLVTVAVAALGVGVAAQSLPSSGLFVPALLACLGGALIWRQASDRERDRLFSSLSTRSDRTDRIRFLAGVTLVVAGAIFVLRSADVTAVRDGLVAMVVTVIGLVLITGPWWMRTVTALSEERAERIRSQERADIAAHLHDSVLQTLALIQRNASSPREVARLARGQERDLRTMLYATPASGQFDDLLRAAAAEVEDAYAITVDVVVVGDAPSDDGLNAVLAAAREALVNAAKHAGVTSVSLYAEVEPEDVAVYVKDRGKGFDMDTIADDRQGVRGSIIGRVERHGGRVEVRTAAGEGTEVEIRMPRS